MQHWVIGREVEVVWILMVSSKVKLLLPIDDAAPGASAELLGVFLVQLGSLGVQSSRRVDLVEDTSRVEEDLPDVVHIPLPLVEALLLCHNQLAC